MLFQQQNRMSWLKLKIMHPGPAVRKADLLLLRPCYMTWQGRQRRYKKRLSRRSFNNG
jgi:hypothetical protein